MTTGERVALGFLQNDKGMCLAYCLQREVSKLYVLSAFSMCMNIHIGHWVGFAFIKQQSYQHKLHHFFSQFVVVAGCDSVTKQTKILQLHFVIFIFEGEG